MSDVTKLAKKLKEAADAYYNGDPVMSDVEFDIKMEELKKLDPNNEFIKQIGAPVEISKWKKIAHDTIHGSQHKVQTKEELKEWIKDKKGPFVIQEKLDGITMVLKFENDKLISAGSRGDGVTGEELLENVQHCDGVKTSIRGFDGTVRGELVLPTSKFLKYFKPEGYRNERNSLGVVRSDDLNKIKHFKFIPYDIVATGFKTEQEMNAKLAHMFGHAVFSKIVKDYDEIIAVYDDYIASKRANIDHAIDGLIIRINDMDSQQALGHTSDRPNGQIAFKFPPKVAKTKLLDIEWGMGISGRLGATAILEPIELDGITIKRCNLNNIDWIKMMDIGIGDEVIIGRSNDVIPIVMGVSSRAGRVKSNILNLPTKCPSCSGTLGQEGVFFICPNVSCSGVIYGNIMRWIQSHALMGIGPAIIREMIANKYVSAADIYKISEKKWEEITGSDKIAKKVLQEVNRTKTVNLDSFLYGLNIDCLGSTNSTRLAKKFEKLDKVLMATPEQIEAIDGIKTNAIKIVSGLKDTMPLINDLLNHIKVNDLSAAGPLAGASICITGELWDSRPTIHKQIQNAGGEVKTSVGKGLTFLATEDTSTGSSKLQKATKLGVKIIDGNMLKKLLSGDKKWQEI